MSDRAMSLPLLALALAMFCDPSVSFAQNDRAATGPTRPAVQAQPTGALVAQTQQAQAQPFVVYFALGKATLDDQARATVASAAQEFQRSGSARISVRGHTDTSGNASFNQALSERREQAVSDELVRLGVPSEAITGEAVGETDLAVPTGDGVREAQNRRVEIAVEAPPPPPAPAPEPTPPVAEAPPPPPLMEELKRGVFSVGPFYGFNTEDESGNTSHLAGLNLGFDYAVLPWLGVGLEQAGFYHFSTKDDGLGGRSAASLNLLLGGITGTDFGPYVGGNIGYLYGEGFDDDFFAGPELGFAVGHFAGKVAYDIPFNRDLDEGIINTTLGFAFQF